MVAKKPLFLLRLWAVHTRHFYANKMIIPNRWWPLYHPLTPSALSAGILRNDSFSDEGFSIRITITTRDNIGSWKWIDSKLKCPEFGIPINVKHWKLMTVKIKVIWDFRFNIEELCLTFSHQICCCRCSRKIMCCALDLVQCSAVCRDSWCSCIFYLHPLVHIRAVGVLPAAFSLRLHHIKS